MLLLLQVPSDNLIDLLSIVAFGLFISIRTSSGISTAAVDIAKMAKIDFLPLFVQFFIIWDKIFTGGGFHDFTDGCGGPISISIKLTEYG